MSTQAKNARAVWCVVRGAEWCVGVRPLTWFGVFVRGRVVVVLLVAGAALLKGPGAGSI
jgi:hypothetical protein